MIYAHMNQATS